MHLAYLDSHRDDIVRSRIHGYKMQKYARTADSMIISVRIRVSLSKSTGSTCEHVSISTEPARRKISRLPSPRRQTNQFPIPSRKSQHLGSDLLEGSRPPLTWHELETALVESNATSRDVTLTLSVDTSNVPRSPWIGTTEESGQNQNRDRSRYLTRAVMCRQNKSRIASRSCDVALEHRDREQRSARTLDFQAERDRARLRANQRQRIDRDSIVSKSDA